MMIEVEPRQCFSYSDQHALQRLASTESASNLEAPWRMPQELLERLVLGPYKVGSWSLNNSVLNTFDFEPDVLQCLMVLHGLPKVTGVQWNPGGPLGQTPPLASMPEAKKSHSSKALST